MASVTGKQGDVGAFRRAAAAPESGSLAEAVDRCLSNGLSPAQIQVRHGDVAGMYARYQVDPEATLRSIGLAWGGVSAERVRQRFKQARLPSRTRQQIAILRRSQRLSRIRNDDGLTAALRDDWIRGASAGEIAQRLGASHSDVKDLATELLTRADHDRRDVALLRRRIDGRAAFKPTLTTAERLAEYSACVRRAWRVHGQPKYFTGAQYEHAARADDSLPALSTLSAHFRWRELLEQAGLECHPGARRNGYSRISPDACWRALHVVAAEAQCGGLPPTRQVYVEHSTGRVDLPCAVTVSRRLGGWDRVLSGWPGPTTDADEDGGRPTSASNDTAA